MAADNRSWFNPMPFLEGLVQSGHGAITDLGRVVDAAGELVGMDEDTIDFSDDPSFVGDMGDFGHAMLTNPGGTLTEMATGPGGLWNMAALLTPAKALPKVGATVTGAKWAGSKIVKGAETIGAKYPHSPTIKGIQAVAGQMPTVFGPRPVPVLGELLAKGKKGHPLGGVDPSRASVAAKWLKKPIDKSATWKQRKLRPFTPGQRLPGAASYPMMAQVRPSEGPTLPVDEAMAQLEKLKQEAAALEESVGENAVPPEGWGPGMATQQVDPRAMEDQYRLMRLNQLQGMMQPLANRPYVQGYFRGGPQR